MDAPAEDEKADLRPAPGFVEVRDGRGRLLFLYDAVRDLVQIKPKGEPAVLVDLRVYQGLGRSQGKAI